MECYRVKSKSLVSCPPFGYCHLPHFTFGSVFRRAALPSLLRLPRPVLFSRTLLISQLVIASRQIRGQGRRVSIARMRLD